MKWFVLVLIAISAAGCKKPVDQTLLINQAFTTMLELENALAVYRFDQGGFPATEDGLQALTKRPDSAESWKGPYVDGELPVDPWKAPFTYEHGAGIYRITSAGPDGQFGNDDDLETRRNADLAKN